MQDFLALYNANRHHDVISLSYEKNISPTSDPYATHIVAASFFRIGDFTKSHDLLSQLHHCFAENIDFLSLYAASCRNVGRLDESKKLFEDALVLDNENTGLLNNYSNLKSLSDQYGVNTHDG